jgi:hypothetical protein
MKKAKILLTAIIALAVLGAALAFKAKTPSTTLYTHLGFLNIHCNGPGMDYLTTTSGGNGTQISASTNDGGTCVAFYTKKE